MEWSAILVIADSKSSVDGSEKLKRLEGLIGYSEFIRVEIIERFLRTLQIALPLACTIGYFGNQFRILVLWYLVIGFAFCVCRKDKRVQP